MFPFHWPCNLSGVGVAKAYDMPYTYHAICTSAGFITVRGSLFERCGAIRIRNIKSGQQI